MDQTVKDEREKQVASAKEADLTPADAVGFTSEAFEFEYTFKVTRTFLTAFGLSISLY